jgi:hypothetical protein
MARAEVEGMELTRFVGDLLNAAQLRHPAAEWAAAEGQRAS